MNEFKKNGIIDPVKSVSNLQKYCSATNIIKHKNTRGLTASFQDGKYALLLGKFINYEIINYEKNIDNDSDDKNNICLLYTSPSPRDRTRSRMPSSA